MKELPNDEFKPFIGRTSFHATLNLLKAKTLKEGRFKLEKYTVTDVKVFQRKNGEVVADLYVNGELKWYDHYTKIDLIRKWFTSAFETYEEFINTPETYDWRAEEYAKYEGEWNPLEDEKAQTDRIHQRLLFIAENAYRKQIKKVDENLKKAAERAEKRKKRLYKKIGVI